MPKKKSKMDRFSRLTWTDIADWAGWKIVSRGKKYQRQGRVSDLVATEDGGLMAWVEGTERYAAKVVMNEDGLLESICTCPFRWDCKHAVAVVLEYLKKVENSQAVPQAKKDDNRFELLKKKGGEEELSDFEEETFEDIEEKSTLF